MKTIKNIFGYIFAAYMLIVFIITMLFIILPVWYVSTLPDPQKTIKLHFLFRVWMGVYLPAVFCPVRRKGADNFAKGENYVVVLNHNSLMDIPVSSPWIPVPNKTLGKIEFSKVPLFGLIYRTGTILVDRESRRSKVESLKQMVATLEKGLNLCIYPEGTRNKTAQPLQPFMEGAFVTAVRAQKPILPGLIFNTSKILPVGAKFQAFPHRIELHFLAPISTKGLTLEDVAALSRRVHDLMEAYYVQNLID
jgi:1-acyl-sn-glycerol-3-phosphate acyltransferase